MLRQSALILILGMALGIAVNQVRRDGIPWVMDWSSEPGLNLKTRKAITISIEEAEQHFLYGDALFLDARPPQLYEQSHILGARNLPLELFEGPMDRDLTNVSKEALIVAYCEGERSFLSKGLALELISRGYKNVRILENGWNQWLAREFPIEAGAWGEKPR